MNNPVVVFVRPEKLKMHLGDLWSDNWSFPLGWTLDGQGPSSVAGKEGLSYCLLLLDDNKDVPEVAHSNKDRTKRLLIVPHNSSTMHRDPSCENDKTAFGPWGRPYLCKGFSHNNSREQLDWEQLDQNDTYTNILILFTNENSSLSFVKARESEDYLTALDNLAAICQIMMINQDQNITEADTIMANSLSRLDSAFCNTFADKKEESWEACLRLIQEKARPLAR